MDGAFSSELQGMDILFNNSVKEKQVFEQKSEPKNKDIRLKIAKIIVLVLCILLVIEAIFYTLIIPCLAPVKVQFSGLNTLTSAELLQKLEDTKASTWIAFDSSRAVESLSSISGIETVAVDKVFPDKVVITIKERVPVAKTIVSINNRSSTVQIDENGVLFTNTASVSTDSNIPLISGLPVDGMQIGMRFPSKYRPLMGQLAEIEKLPQNYFAGISEIQVLQKEYGNYELVLFPIQSHVKVLADRSLDEDAIKRMMVILDVVNSIEVDVNEVDLRYGSVSYKTR